MFFNPYLIEIHFEYIIFYCFGPHFFLSFIPWKKLWHLVQNTHLNVAITTYNTLIVHSLCWNVSSSSVHWAKCYLSYVSIKPSCSMLYVMEDMFYAIIYGMEDMAYNMQWRTWHMYAMRTWHISGHDIWRTWMICYMLLS